MISTKGSQRLLKIRLVHMQGVALAREKLAGSIDGVGQF